MYPQTKDNFGVDACSLVVLASNPPTIVFAEPTGKLFHGLLLELNSDELDNVSNEIQSEYFRKFHHFFFYLFSVFQ